MPFPAPGAAIVVATMHGKEQAVAPVLHEAWNATVRACDEIDTDRFGTFTRDLPRHGSPLDAARGKIAAARSVHPGERLILASEGSFGPHPQVPGVALGIEIIVLRCFETGLEIQGHDASSETNYAFRRVRSVTEALAFADAAGFPSHGLVLMPCAGAEPAAGTPPIKDRMDRDSLATTCDQLLRRASGVWLETDMRAHRNPTRMRAIARATRDLVQRAASRCPRCTRPGFSIVERIAGLRCRACGAPTREWMAERWQCAGCRHQEVRLVAEDVLAEPSRCDDCNP